MAETLSHIVKKALIGMIATVTNMVPPKDAAPPPFIQAAIDRAVERISAAVPAAEQHPDDVAVDRFAVAMKAKLAAARAKGRYGWDDPEQCSDEELAGELVEHLSKGNTYTFEDVANFAMMLHQRGAAPEVLAAAAAPAQVAQEPSKLEKLLVDEERSHSLTVDQRDRAEEMATKLAEAVGHHFGRDVGEHSSANCPLENALILLNTAPPAAEQPGTVRVPVETLQHIHRDLDACQKVIWLAGCRPFGYGFDPAYVTAAQARLKDIEALLGKEAPHA